MLYPLGTRVRIVRSNVGLAGMEAAISGTPSELELTADPEYIYLMLVDGIRSSHRSGEWRFRHCDIEPITKYDGNQVTEWRECLWQPEHAKQYPEE